MWLADSIANFVPRPFFAEPTGLTSSGCDVANFDPASFQPAWRWRDTDRADWAWPSAGPTNLGTYWHADVDGDGLMDRIVETGAPAVGVFRPADVWYTRRYSASEVSSGFQTIQRPFWDLSPGPRGQSLTSAPKSSTRYYFVDMNGDGLVDLVTATNGSAKLDVRPGDGHGRFACDETKQPWPCAAGVPTPSYQIQAPPDLPVFDNDTLIHDVTGDGLVDIVHYDPESGNVSLWINLDGQHFGYAATGCVIGRTFDDVHGTFNVGVHSILGADMNGDGIDDVVILAQAGIFVIPATQKSPRGFVQHASRPGLLTHIDNGRGATTRIHYRTISRS